MFIFLQKIFYMTHKNSTQIESMSDAAYILKAISNGIRLSVISALKDVEEIGVSELIETIGCEQSLLSHHLTDMRAKGILMCRKEGKRCYYSLTNKHFIQILNCIEKCKDCNR